jgi:crotonobetainyl-CoA:carnitine CoA-transferase CaiB-like acyl-CoA transferase
LTSITPFGQSGPYVEYKVTDIVAVAMGGMVGVFGDEDRPPVRISAPQAYFLGAQQGAVGSLSALYHREITGEGQWVDVSIQEAIVFTLTYYLPPWEHLGIFRKRSGADFTRPRLPPLGDLRTRWMFPCLDGYVCLAFQGGGGAGIKSSREMVAWANEEGFAQKIKEYRWETWDSGTMEQSQQDYLQENIAPFLATKTKTELLEGAAKRRILLAPVYTVADLPENPQFSFRDFWKKVSHPELNETLTYPGPFVKVEQCPQQIFRRAPDIGEHNREIYGEAQGMSTEQLNLLKAQGVI